MSDENLIANQYFVSTEKFIQLEHVKIRLPNGNITDFDYNKTYIINAVDTSGQKINPRDSDVQYRFYSTDNSILIIPNEGDSYDFQIRNISKVLKQGSNIILTTVSDLNNVNYGITTIQAIDTKYKTIIGTGAAANAATTNGNTYITFLSSLDLNNTFEVQNKYNIAGSGTVRVTSDLNGNITISGINTNVDTTYTDGRFLKIGTQKVNGSYPISSTLSGDDLTIELLSTDETSGKFKIKAANTDGMLLSTTLVGSKLSAGWAEPIYVSHDTKYNLHINETNINGLATLSLKRDNTIDQDNIKIIGTGSTAVYTNANGLIVIYSPGNTSNTYYADEVTIEYTNSNQNTFKVKLPDDGIAYVSTVNGTKIIKNINPPSDNGTYALVCKKVNGVCTYSWVEITEC